MNDASDTNVPTDRGGLEILALEECRSMLASQQIGRIAFLSAGEPLIMPVNYRLHDGHVVFRTTTGEKLDAARGGKVVAFEIDDWNVASQTGWSVIVRGTAEDVWEEGEIAELNALGLRPWAAQVARRNWVKIVPDEITGRRIL